MARKNNKGFSIVEVIIAITILSLLLVPIINQISQTFRTSRNAKKQQYVTDNAVYLMEDFQKSSLEELELKYGTALKDTKTCQVYDSTGTAISGAEVTYHYLDYPVESIKLGTDQSNFTRKVVLDDLTACLMAYDAGEDALSGEQYGYKMALLDDDLSGFERNSEGYQVKYDTDGFVVGVACELTDRISNPNTINLGNMQNLDSTKVAIIPGSATNFDAQADTAFFSIMMERLKEVDYASWQQAMIHSDNDSVLNQYYNLENTKKLTKIYIDEAMEGTDQTYTVSVDVAYQNNLNISGNAYNAYCEYNVYSQKFYMDECPAVYIEYQPYAVDSTATSVTYAANDYILVDNYVDGAKIYLYKPADDQMNLISGVADTGHLDGDTTVYTFYRTKGSSNKVNIHVCSLNKKLDEHGNAISEDIYTNIDKSNFNTTKFTEFSSVEANDSSANERDDFGTIKLLSEDERRNDRLFTINVTLTPDADDISSNSVHLTGAKGEN